MWRVETHSHGDVVDSCRHSELINVELWELAICHKSLLLAGGGSLGCARNCARNCLQTAQPYPTPAKRANENPSVSWRLTEGRCERREHVRPVLCQLS